MEIDYNDLIDMAGADGHSLQLLILTVGIDYGIGESFSSRCEWEFDANQRPILRGIEHPYSAFIQQRGYIPCLSGFSYAVARQNYPNQWPFGYGLKTIL